MKRFNKIMLFSVAFLAMAVTGCNGAEQKNQEGSSSSQASSQPQPEPAGPSVFILTGQSNMEGKSRVDETALRTFCSENNFDGVENILASGEGIPEVRTSFYGCGYGEIYKGENNIHASYDGDGLKINGKFLNTKVGMGDGSSTIGPELGAALAIREEVDPEMPVYFIKCGISGSGFDQGDSQGSKCDWNVEKDESLYSNILKPYTTNCLNLIEEETGMKPVIKGWLWNQGESDAYDGKIELYNDRFDTLFNKFKTDFAEYAPDEEGDNIALIDALIFEGTEGQRNYKPVEMNDEKLKNIARHDNYYYVDATQREGGLALTMGGDNLHYNFSSMLKLGMAYGQAILEHNLLD